MPHTAPSSASARAASLAVVLLTAACGEAVPDVPSASSREYPSAAEEIESPTSPSSADTKDDVDDATDPLVDRSPREGRGNAVVTRVIDGDTIEVRFQGTEIDVRLIGVDTPETVHPTEPVECYGPQASAFAERRLEGERVRLEFDAERLDPYGRTLAYVWDDGRLFNRVLVLRGFATVTIYEPNDEHALRLYAAQRKANRTDRGVWAACGLEAEEGGDGGAGRGGADGGGAAGGGGGSRCTAGYSPCLPPASDYDCAGGEGDGPEYTGRVEVSGSDPYGLDSDGDGVGCEG